MVEPRRSLIAPLSALGIAALAFCELAATSFAQAPATPVAGTPVGVATPGASPSPKNKNLLKRVLPDGTSNAEIENIRKALESMTPEQRQEFRQNLTKWINLPPEEKKALRDQSDLRRKQMAEDIAEAITKSGLELDQNRQKQFVKRYTQERRKLEEQLRTETESKRGPLVQAVIDRLKVEFNSPGNSLSGATPTPAAIKNAP